ncbi:hypothetical protein [Streptomyces sp. NPDC059861]|uniref:hypothetical protein n=1 Tax=Streptomyces sp. NPDC059861 TaxID=3346974 RepID=UPI003650403D
MRGAWSAFSTQSPRRRGALLGAAAALVCTGCLLAACGSGGGDDGYVAVGAAGGPPRAAGTGGAPPGKVTLVPLDGTRVPGGTAEGRNSPDNSPGSSRDSAPAADATPGQRPPGEVPPPLKDAPTPADEGSTAPPFGDGTDPGSTTTDPPPPAPTRPESPTPGPGRPAPAGPAEMSMGTPVRAPADKRWCEQVTVTFHNTGDSAVRSGTVTFGTHIIGALGIDWGTIESTEALPAPIAAGARKEQTWTVCVDAWRVPLGMHVETRDVSVRWE